MPVAKTLRQPCLFPHCNLQLRFDVQSGALAVLPASLRELDRHGVYQERKRGTGDLRYLHLIITMLNLY